jgi:hypothetical protein
VVVVQGRVHAWRGGGVKLRGQRRLTFFGTLLYAYLPPPLPWCGGSPQPARGHWQDVTRYVAAIGRRCVPVDKWL